MKLHWSPKSPFVRKVMIVLYETELLDRVQLTRSVVAAQLPPNTAVLADNPLGKIPTLITDTGKPVFDSRVICEYLDRCAGTGLFPDDCDQRLNQLCWQALGDGLIDILLLWRIEMTRREGPWTELADGWRAKVQFTMARLEVEAAALRAAPFGIGQISVICALGQLDFRWADCGWRAQFPMLAALSAAWEMRPSVQATAVVNDLAAGELEPTLGQLSFVR